MCSSRVAVFTYVCGILLACKSCGTSWIVFKLSLILAVRVLCSDLSKRPVGLILCVLALQSLANRLLKYQ